MVATSERKTGKQRDYTLLIQASGISVRARYDTTGDITGTQGRWRLVACSATQAYWAAFDAWAEAVDFADAVKNLRRQLAEHRVPRNLGQHIALSLFRDTQTHRIGQRN